MPIPDAIQLSRYEASSLARLEGEIVRQRQTIAKLNAAGHETKDAVRSLEAMVADCRFFKKLRDRRSPAI